MNHRRSGGVIDADQHAGQDVGAVGGASPAIKPALLWPRTQRFRPRRRLYCRGPRSRLHGGDGRDVAALDRCQPPDWRSRRTLPQLQAALWRRPAPAAALPGCPPTVAGPDCRVRWRSPLVRWFQHWKPMQDKCWWLRQCRTVSARAASTWRRQYCRLTRYHAPVRGVPLICGTPRPASPMPRSGHHSSFSRARE
jgi:hypothetical protein